jgi:hypothetical protein
VPDDEEMGMLFKLKSKIIRPNGRGKRKDGRFRPFGGSEFKQPIGN